MRKPKLRELGEAIKALFKGPYTVKFPKAPAKVFPNFRGRIVFNEEKCVGCGACVEVCPAKARAIEDDKERKIRKVIHYQEKCIYCGQCVRYCITQEGIRHTPDFELSSLTKDGYENYIEKELVLCELCGEVVGTKDHLLWIYKRVGEAAYQNPTLFLTHHRILGLTKTEIPKVLPYRSGHIRILCPECRRKVYLQEIWGY
ncbi:MAG: 4Fe-4S binding protein [candidate division WOR-3 bacterium]